ncbi:hypothetical protein NDU88_007243 [Pleurodeles waltl]|uniref:Uncharacterized protein n=1 Tax=Pleurodeles waltl TaxID=8319 RepID=A0AAV7LUA0_PLEWA|nr:hypothetical protein NDU88_007243 [Pleurodeles waltl]
MGSRAPKGHSRRTPLPAGCRVVALEHPPRPRPSPILLTCSDDRPHRPRGGKHAVTAAATPLAACRAGLAPCLLKQLHGLQHSTGPCLSERTRRTPSATRLLSCAVGIELCACVVMRGVARGALSRRFAVRQELADHIVSVSSLPTIAGANGADRTTPSRSCHYFALPTLADTVCAVGTGSACQNY